MTSIKKCLYRLSLCIVQSVHGLHELVADCKHNEHICGRYCDDNSHMRQKESRIRMYFFSSYFIYKRRFLQFEYYISTPAC